MNNLAKLLVNKITEKQKVICFIGDAMKDIWIHGYLEKCQDGCPKFVEEGYLTTPGGVINAYKCLVHWHERVELYCSSTHMTTKTRLVDTNGKIVMRVDNDKVTNGPPRWDHDRSLEMIPHASAVVLSDYDKGFLTPGYVREVLALCAKHNVLCVADAKREPALYDGALLKGNLEYADRWRCLDAMDVCTAGWAPPLLEGRQMSLRLPPVECRNHVGAGDCFTAFLALALAYGFSLADAATLAHSAGRVYVQHRHNRPPYPDEVAADLASGSSMVSPSPTLPQSAV